MKNILTILTGIVVFGAACNPKPTIIDDLSDITFELVNEDSTNISFPGHFEGDYVVMGFIYTNCPDICPLVTQNLVKIQKELNYPDDVQFVAASFDPFRDTPSVLSKYKDAFRVDKNFTFLTGDTTTVSAFMDSVKVRSQVSMTTTTGDGKEIYFLNHSDKIMVLDPKSRVVLEYGGSMTPVSYIVEDIQKLRN
ncbi:MAG: SCO family protein [Bacteroidota bacterium]